jgi:hypothetical protein
MVISKSSVLRRAHCGRHPYSIRRAVQRANFEFATLANVKASATFEIDKRTGICRECIGSGQLARAGRHARRFDQAIKK